MKIWALLIALIVIIISIFAILHKGDPPLTGELNFSKPTDWTWVQQDRVEHPMARAPLVGDFHASISLVSQYHDGDFQTYYDLAVKYCEIAFWEYPTTNHTATSLDDGTTGVMYQAKNDRFPAPILQDQYYFHTNDFVHVLTYTRLLAANNPAMDAEAAKAIRSFKPPPSPFK